MSSSPFLRGVRVVLGAIGAITVLGLALAWREIPRDGSLAAAIHGHSVVRFDATLRPDLGRWADGGDVWIHLAPPAGGRPVVARFDGASDRYDQVRTATSPRTMRFVGRRAPHLDAAVRAIGSFRERPRAIIVGSDGVLFSPFGPLFLFATTLVIGWRAKGALGPLKEGRETSALGELLRVLRFAAVVIALGIGLVADSWFTAGAWLTGGIAAVAAVVLLRAARSLAIWILLSPTGGR
jgi:hypothetical protein